MCLGNSWICVVILIICYFLNSEVYSIKINCVPLDTCPFAINVLSKRYVPMSSEIWNLFKMSRCGYEETTKKVKFWCPEFINCMTPDKKLGTCIPVKDCAVVTDLLKNNMTLEQKNNLSEYKCNMPQEPDVLICCPFPANSSPNQMSFKIAPSDQEDTSRKRRDVNQPWFALNNRNIFDPSQNLPFYQNRNLDSGLENKNNFDWSKFGSQYGGNIFTQQSTNFFDSFRTRQADAIKKLQNSLQQQNNLLQSRLQNTTKELTEANTNFKNKLLNLFPGKNQYDQYNLTEETSDSVQEICLTPDNIEGTCIELRQCPAFVKALRKANTKDSIQREYLRNFNCTNIGSGNPKICCPENPIIIPGTVTQPVQSETKAKERTGNSLDSVSNICGRQIIDDKIIGGTTTDLAEFPWTALLQYTSPKGLSFACGGSIINNRYILTAAHCVNINILRQAGLQNLKKVVLGEYDRRNETDCFYTRYGSNCADPPQSFGVEEIREHELFRSNETPHDIALVRLDRDITFSNYIRPICLPTRNSLNLKGNETFFITGWGRTESGETSPVKRKAKLPFVNKDNCSQLGPLENGQMCLGSGKGIDSCKGDSGGPVMLNTLTRNDIVQTLVGIISFGFGTCGTTTSVSTYVPHYIDWILKNIF